jgi:hypothetical protein
MTMSASSHLNCGRIQNFNVVGQKQLATYDLTATAGFFPTRESRESQTSQRLPRRDKGLKLQGQINA